jgi:serine/threonine protein kinase
VLGKMLSVNPVNRPSAEDLLKYNCPNLDLNKTIAKSNSNPDLLKTIKLPNNMMQLNEVLPKKKYKNGKENNVQLSRDISMASNIGNVSNIQKHQNQQITNI